MKQNPLINAGLEAMESQSRASLKAHQDEDGMS